MKLKLDYSRQSQALVTDLKTPTNILILHSYYDYKRKFRIPVTESSFTITFDTPQSIWAYIAISELGTPNRHPMVLVYSPLKS